jgi:hypothetical protein
MLIVVTTSVAAGSAMPTKHLWSQLDRDSDVITNAIAVLQWMNAVCSGKRLFGAWAAGQGISGSVFSDTTKEMSLGLGARPQLAGSTITKPRCDGHKNLSPRSELLCLRHFGKHIRLNARRTCCEQTARGYI